jgi:hypothetical protein
MPIIKEVKYGEDNSIESAPELTEEEKDALEKRKKCLSELLQRECIGEYKIEVLFSHKRSRDKPTPGALSVWGSGQKLHGGGDTKMYFCPGSMRKVNECSSPIGFDNVNYNHVLCSKCGKVWKGDEVIGEIMGVWPVEIWAKKITDCFIFLGQNADVYIKQPRGDLRKAAQLEQEKQHMGEKLSAVRTGMIRYIYPLKRIIDDTKNGADLYGRFYAFLKS